MDELQNQTFRFGRGLNLVDAPEMLQEGQARVFQNFRLRGLGRATTRKAVRSLGATTNIQWLAVVPYTAVATYAAVALGWNSSSQIVALYKVDAAGARTLVGGLAGYTSLASAPTVHADVVNGVVFVVDEAKVKGLTIWDPNDRLGSGSDFFQPTFDFDLSGAGHAVAKANLLTEHRNHLFIFGYGDETDPDHPEMVRFSFLNLVDDGHGSGDVGTGSAEARSLNLFDNEDVRTFVPKGERIMLAASAPDRLLLCTQRAAWVIHGSDYETWEGDELDSERGAVNSKAGCTADGEFYWWSPLGPSRYRGGGRVEDLLAGDWGSIAPLIEEMDLATLFAVHAVAEHQIRWHFRRKDDTTAGCDRLVAFDYQNQAWIMDVMGGPRVTCGGYLRPSGLESPAAAPSSLTFSNTTHRSTLASWTPGDFSVGVRTLVYRAPDNAGVAGTYVLIHTLEGAASQCPIVGLESATKYWVKVVHLRNGASSAAVEDDVTTAAAGTAQAPANLTAVNRSYWYGSEQGLVYGPTAALTWEIVETGVTVHIERKTGVGGTYAEVFETPLIDQAMYVDTDVVVGTEYYYRVRAEDADGVLSSYSNEANLTIAVVPFDADPVASQVVVT